MGRQSGQVGGLRVRTGKGHNQETNREHINTQGMMGNTWRVVETITKMGETDQGVTVKQNTIIKNRCILQ
jgi:hypothetical protein